MKTTVYIDGFNLYYGCLRGSAYRWLDVEAMCRALLPNDEIQQIKYFTARVTARPNDPDKPLRQQSYLRALQTIPNLQIIYGAFLSHEVTMPLAPPAKGYAKVIKTEEKGSDVNLATQLLVDGFRNNYELAVIVSNDSDLLAPIQVVTRDLGKHAGLLNPHKNPSVALIPHVRFVKNIRPGVLRRCQFPPALADKQGSFAKPSGW